VKRSPASWVQIDRLFTPVYRGLQLIIDLISPVRDRPGQAYVVMKFFGMGSIIRLLALCEEKSIDLDKVVLVTFSSNREVCLIWGLKGIYIESGSLVQMIRSSIGAIVEIVRLKPALIVDFERCSQLSALFRTVAAWLARCRSVGFELRSYTSRTSTVHSILNMTQVDIFQKGIDGFPRAGTKSFATPVEIIRRKVIVNVNASQLLPGRRYPIAGFASLIKGLASVEKDLEFVLTGTIEERAYVQQIPDSLYLDRVSNVAGQWTLSQFVRELSDCRLFITVDSAPLHLAASMNVPTIAIWGPTQPRHFGYLATPTLHPISLQLPCSPCFLHPRSRPAEACKGAITCMNNLDHNIIKEKAIEVMAASTSIRDVIFPLKFVPETINALV
jgi:hypothetical protein